MWFRPIRCREAGWAPARWAATGGALAAALSVSAPALAQNVPEGGDGLLAATLAPPAERLAVTPGGVDMRTGRYQFNETDLSIGEDNESGGLALTRRIGSDGVGHIAPLANFSHNFDIFIDFSTVPVRSDGSGPGSRLRVHFGGRSETFEDSAGGFSQVSRSGYARLTAAGNIYTYTSNDGTVAVFRTSTGDCSTAWPCSYASTVTYADGTRLTFDYDPPAGAGTAHLRAVTSSRGYMLVFQYGSGADSNFVVGACALNLTIAPAPAGHACPASPAASASYAYTNAGGARRLAAATNAGNETASYAYPAATSEGYSMTFTRAGETAPWLTNNVWVRPTNDSIDDVVMQQVFADNATYAYSYDFSPEVPGEIPQLAGGYYVDPAGHTVEVRYDFPIKPGSTWGNVGGGGQGEQQTLFYQITPGPVRIVDALGRVSTNDYCDPNAAANLPSWEQHRCLVMPMPVSFADPEGIRTDLLWDHATRLLGRATQHARPGTTPAMADIVRSATYNCTPATMASCAKPITRTDANGNVTDYSYDPVHGGLLSETGPAPGAGAPRPQVRHEYAQRYAWLANGSGGYAASGPIWVRTATSTCRTSAATGNAGTPCAVAGDEVRTTYDYGPDSGPNTLLLLGQLVTATDNGVTTALRTCYGYDARGRRISETRPNANLASCPASPPASAAPDTSAQRYDAMGRVTGTISASPGDGNPYLAVRNSYDPAGRLIKVETGSLSTWQSEAVAPAGWSGFTVYRTLETQYDAMSRKTRETLREGAAGAIRSFTQMSYDIMGRLDCTAVRMNPAQFPGPGSGAGGALPDSAACTLGVAGSDGPDRITKNLYDAAGQRIQLREGVGTNDAAAEATWRYNLDGQVTELIDGNGNRAVLCYDGHGRQSRWLFPSPDRPAGFLYDPVETALVTAGAANGACTGTDGDFESYGYDANGNRTRLRRRDGSAIDYQYDALNRMTVKIVPERAGLTAAQTRDAYYGYDLRNLQLYARFDSAAGPGIANAYDGFGRLASTTANTDGTARTIAYQHDRDGNRIAVTHPDGNWFAYVRDGLGRLYWLAASDNGACYYSSYRPDGLPASQSRCNGASTWTSRDALGRLNGLGHYYGQGGAGDVLWLYDFNPASQISSLTRDNDAYAWTGHQAADRAYTANGLNQYTTVGAAGYGYDLNGNLASEPAPGGGSRSYVYDVENRLVSATPGGTLSYDPLGRLSQLTAGDGTVTRFLYDGDALVAEYDAAGEMTRRYVHWEGADVPIMSYAGASLASPTYLHPDHQGSIVAVSGASGLSQLNRYDEYGIPAATNEGRFQYTGQAWLAELGLYHYKARLYSPALGRFLQTDPVGYEDQFNLYEYVGNDPVNRTDPIGEFSAACMNREFGSWIHCNNQAERTGAEAGASGLWPIVQALERYNPVNVAISAITLGDVSPPEVGGQMHDFFRAPLANGLDVLAALPAVGRTAGAAASGTRQAVGIAARALGLAERAGRNSISLRSPGQILRVHLVGSAHGPIPTPHVHRYRLHTNPATGQTRMSQESVTPASHQELRWVERLLRNMGL